MSAALDPITFQVIRHKLHRIVDEAIVALKNVSGSPVTNEAHDMMVSLYKADGSLMVGGSGFLHHISSAAQAVKHIIASFSEDPGIDEDDVFFFNDSYTAALHPPDVYLISPIFYQGELASFVANFVHVNDIGAINPGGLCPDARESYQEGFQTKGLKIVERGKPRRDVIETFLNMVRDADMTALDLKSQLSANHVAKERMTRLYQDYGLATVAAVSEALIQQSEQLMRARLRELPDGEWQSRQYLDLADGELLKVELTATKRGDTLTYDFTGTDPQVDFGINCCYWATWGAMLAPILPLLAWDLVWNDGVLRPFRLIAPEGTCVNCRRPAPVSIATVGNVHLVNNVSAHVLGKMLGASEKYKERAMAIWRGSHASVHLHGRNKRAEPFVVYTTDSFAGAGGARAFRDGVDVAGEIANVVSRMANVEQDELNAPMLFLYRRAVTDSGGPGKWRGGQGHEFAVKPHDAVETGGVAFGKGVRVPLAYGLFGGLPGSHVAYRLFRNASLEELPASLETTLSEVCEDRQWGQFQMSANDVLYIRNIGSGGYGDPLEREPGLVRDDVYTGAVSSPAAEQIYGVLFDDQHQVDQTATEHRREQIRRERLGGRAPSNGRADVSRTHQRISEYLQIRGVAIECTYCGERISSADEHWKDRAVRHAVSASAAGPKREADDRIVLVEYCCPACATLLEAEVLRRGDPPARDRIHGWPAI